MASLTDALGEGGGSLKTPGLSSAVGGSSNKKLMADARTALSGNWGMAVLGYILYTVLIMSIALFTYSALIFVGVVTAASGANVGMATHTISFSSQIVQLVLSGAFMVGFCSFFLVIAREGEARLECLFTGFRRFGPAIGAYFLSSLFIILWTMLFIIPGIIATFRYAMVYFVVADEEEEAGPLEAIRMSKEMMKGNKWKFFCLHWRFLWWGLLCMIMPIGYLWLVPYMQTTFARFYEDVK